MTGTLKSASEQVAGIEAPTPVGAGIAGDVALALAGLEERPVEEHPEVFESVHERLRTTLSGIDHV